MKKELIDESGITIARYHDHAHVLNNDAICEGELKYLGLKGEKLSCGIWAVNRFVLDEEVTARELAKVAEVITEKHPELNTKYIECGEVYSYTD